MMKIHQSLILLLVSSCICSAKALGGGLVEEEGGGGGGEVLAEDILLGTYLKRKAGDAAVETESKASSDTSPPETNAKVELPPERGAVAQARVASDPRDSPGITETQLAGVIGGVALVGFIGIIAAAVCWYRIRQSAKDASDVEYPAYGVTGPVKERLGSPGDRKLAQSVQMYHYQHQKQQMIALEKANGEMKHDASDDESEEENEEGDYTVYECPGLAPTGEMEVKNPLFSEDSPPSEKRPEQGSP